MTYPNQPKFVSIQDDFDEFIKLHQGITWLGFDTEFIGENRLIPLLCLIQISSEHGIFLIDPIALKDLSPLLSWFEDPNILKITHAGNNDYALLYALFTTEPKNVFDVQIAAGFLGYPYPVGFQKMIKSVLDRSIGKAASITDWSIRPLSEKQLIYAADDVRYLHDLWSVFRSRLKDKELYEWAEEEFELMVQKATESSNWQEEFLKFKQMTKLHTKERLLVLRILRWRSEVATEGNISKDAVFPQKMIMEVIKNIKQSKNEINKHRLLNRSKVKRNWLMFKDFYTLREQNSEEQELLKVVGNIKRKSPEENLRYTFLKLMIKQRCYEYGIPDSLIVNGMGLSNPILENFPKALTSGWRGEMLGSTLVDWLTHKSPLNFEFAKESCVVTRRR